MAFQMSFTDNFGVVYPESYWKVVATNICQADKVGNVTFYGYQDEANKGKRIIGTKNYAVSNGAYLACFDVDSLNPNGANPVAASYVHALATKDVDSISFFENALVV